MKGEKMWGRQGEVNRRRGRCLYPGCLCANNYPDEIHRDWHEMQRKRRRWDLGNTSRHTKKRETKGEEVNINIL